MPCKQYNDLLYKNRLNCSVISRCYCVCSVYSDVFLRTKTLRKLTPFCVKTWWVRRGFSRLWVTSESPAVYLYTYIICLHFVKHKHCNGVVHPGTALWIIHFWTVLNQLCTEMRVLKCILCGFGLSDFGMLIDMKKSQTTETRDASIPFFHFRSDTDLPASKPIRFRYWFDIDTDPISIRSGTYLTLYAVLNLAGCTLFIFTFYYWFYSLEF